MSETRDLIGIYGALGRAAKERGEEVRRFVPAFTEENADWIEDFTAWTIETSEEESGRPYPELDEALRNLAKRRVSGPAATRRIFALGAAMRGFPEIGDPESERGQAAMASLVATELVDDDRAPDLLAALASDEELDQPGLRFGEALDAWWESIASVVSPAGGLIVEDALGPRPCTGSLVPISVPDAGPYAAGLTTSFKTKQVTFERACQFLAPANWPNCHPFWCDMDFITVRPSGAHHYREVVSTDCANAEAAWTIAVDLDFTFHKEPDRAVTKYRLAEGHPMDDDEVLVNAGTLVVDRWDGGVKVRTTKRLLFRREPPSPEVMATVLCLVGYGSAVEDLVFGCAIDPNIEPEHEFPASDEEEQGAAGESAGASLLDALATRYTHALQRCLDRGSQKGAESRARMREGKYGADALARDAVDLAVHSLKEATEGFRSNLRASRRAATAERERNRAGGDSG